MQWNTEFVDQKVEEIASLIPSLKSMSNCLVRKFSSILLSNKSKRPSTRLQLPFSDAAKLFTIGTSKILTMIRSSLFTKWLLRINKLLKSSFFWQALSKVQKIKLMTLSPNLIDSNGFGKNQFQNLSKILPRALKNPNCLLMKSNLKNSLQLNKILTKLNLLL